MCGGLLYARLVCVAIFDSNFYGSMTLLRAGVCLGARFWRRLSWRPSHLPLLVLFGSHLSWRPPSLFVFFPIVFAPNLFALCHMMGDNVSLAHTSCCSVLGLCFLYIYIYIFVLIVFIQPSILGCRWCCFSFSAMAAFRQLIF